MGFQDRGRAPLEEEPASPLAAFNVSDIDIYQTKRKSLFSEARDKGLETAHEIQLTDYRDKTRARIPPVRGLFARNEEISALTGLRGGPGRRTHSKQFQQFGLSNRFKVAI